MVKKATPQKHGSICRVTHFSEKPHFRMNTFAVPLPHDPFVTAEVSTGYVAIKPANASQPAPQVSCGVMKLWTSLHVLGMEKKRNPRTDCRESSPNHEELA